MKKETLEEVADRLNFIGRELYALKLGAKWQQEQDNKELAMWKLAVERQESRCKALNSVISTLQERMYSEEDMRLAINKARDISDGKDCFDAEDISGCTEVCTYGWKFNMSEDLIIEQIKKK